MIQRSRAMPCNSLNFYVFYVAQQIVCITAKMSIRVNWYLNIGFLETI